MTKLYDVSYCGEPNGMVEKGRIFAMMTTGRPLLVSDHEVQPVQAKAKPWRAADPTGATYLAATATPPWPPRRAELSGSNDTEIQQERHVEGIKSKFLNEIDKIPRGSFRSALVSLRRL
ncbi:unnamed protein product [Arctogadus glacialis]